MDLAQLTDQPTPIEISGRHYGFSELSFDALGELQQWIKDKYPHPLRSIQGYLDGFSDDDREELLRQAREEAKHWPPVVGTAAGTAALLKTEEGQVQALWAALKVHQPETTLIEGRRLYKALQNESIRWAKRKAKGQADAGEAKVSRIFGIAFGMDQVEDDGPKA